MAAPAPPAIDSELGADFFPGAEHQFILSLRLFQAELQLSVISYLQINPLSPRALRKMADSQSA